MRSTRLAALTVAVTLALSGLALARDHDGYKDKHDHYKEDHHRDDHYKHDRYKDDHYKDRHDDHHDWEHIFNRDRDRDRDRDNHHWWESSREKERDHDRWERDHGNVIYGGPVYNRYPGGYGYPSGGYPVGSVYGRGGYGGYGGGYGGGAGYRQGMEDGSYQARKDISQGKPFNPNPRGSSHSDHGYNSSMGDKHVYQASYDQGYHSGYQANYGGGGRRGWGF